MKIEQCIEREAVIACKDEREALFVINLLTAHGLIDVTPTLDRSHNHVKVQKDRTFKRIWQGLSNRVNYCDFIHSNK